MERKKLKLVHLILLRLVERNQGSRTLHIVMRERCLQSLPFMTIDVDYRAIQRLLV